MKWWRTRLHRLFRAIFPKRPSLEKDPYAQWGIMLCRKVILPSSSWLWTQQLLEILQEKSDFSEFELSTQCFCHWVWMSINQRGHLHIFIDTCLFWLKSGFIFFVELDKIDDQVVSSFVIYSWLTKHLLDAKFEESLSFDQLVCLSLSQS